MTSGTSRMAVSAAVRITRRMRALLCLVGLALYAVGSRGVNRGLGRELLELFRRPGDHAGVRGQRLRGGRDLLLGFRPVFLLDRLAHTGKRLDAIARVKSRRIDLVTVPGAPRQTGGAHE